MIAEVEIIEAVRERLQEALKKPVRLEKPSRDSTNLGIDGILRAGDHRLVVEVKTSSRISSVRAACDQALRYSKRIGRHVIPLVAVPFMGPSGRRVCESFQVGFIDMSGNLHVEGPGLFLHVEGKPNQLPPRGRPLSAFASKSARVARVLLLDPRRAWRQRELVDKTGIGRGFVSRIVKRLMDDGFLESTGKAQFLVRDPDLLLDAWRDEYTFGRHRIIAGHIPARSGPELTERLVKETRKHGVEYSLTGLPAAALLAPYADYRLVACYLRRVPSAALLSALGFQAGEKGANAWLAIPNDEGVFDGSLEIAGQQCVSAVQAYLDLGHMPERAKEAAEHLRKVLLTWR